MQRFFLTVALLLLAAVLLMDSTTFRLRKSDPVTGRGRGCYTEMEILLGVKQPTEWIRLSELAAAGVLALSGIAVLITWRKSE